jgi:alpha-glucosidase (family GH31 glycosyl hydrolase)
MCAGVWESRPVRRAAAVSIVVALAALCAPAAGARVSIGQRQVVVEAPGARAVITRSPFRLEVLDGPRRVLREVGSASARKLTVPDTQRSVSGRIDPPGPALYAPLAFLVGEESVTQTPSGQFSGNLATVRRGGVEYAARAVIGARRAGRGVRLELSTSDPSGRRLLVRVGPGPKHGSLRVSARPTPDDGVAAMSDSFVAPAGEAFRGFGGRHDALDQRGSAFYNWLAQENLSSATTDGLTAAVPGTVRDTLYPNGPEAAYYVQSSFISSAGYGFLLDREELSHWRLGSDRPGSWRVEAAAPALDYVVTPGAVPRAIATLTAITGRQRVPPRWALGPALDREVKFPLDPAPQYEQEVRQDLRDLRRYGLPLDAYRIEGWQFLPRPALAEIIRALRERGIKPMLYFRAFVGRDEIGTDDPAAFDEALRKGYVATRADGSPYVFTTNFFRDGAVIDFTKRAAVRWWQRRIREALELGADGFMQDFGEQVQADMRFASGRTGASMHNRLPILFHRATRAAVNAFERTHPGRRIFFFTRAGYTGTPGAAAYEGGNFPGDETTDWSHAAGIASLTTDMLNRAVGGAYGFTADIGGFFDVGPYESPTSKELFQRWAEWAALSPFFRLHGSVLAGVHTPWSYDGQTVRRYNALARLHLRARGLILTLWRHARRTGIPPTRPLWLAYPGDRRAARQDQEWLLGGDVLVAPVVVKGARSRSVYFPRGCWRSPSTGARYHGPRAATVPAPLGRPPYFFRCGTRPF